MKNILLVIACMAAAGLAFGQQYKWVDKDGKVRYGDTPPPGVKATPLRPPPPAPAAPSRPAAKDDKKAPPAAKKGPLTPAEQEAEFRKRQLEQKKELEEQAKAKQEMQARKENCVRATEQAAALATGRVAGVNPQGERYFLDEDQIAREKAKNQQAINQFCN